MYLSPDVERILSGYHWSGNIRELENVIKRALMLALSGPILPEHLPPHLQEDVSIDDGGQWDERLNQLLKDFILNNNEEGTIYETLIQKVEKHLFEILLSKYSGKQVATAKVLGINRNTLKRKIDAMKISPKNHEHTGCDLFGAGLVFFAGFFRGARGWHNMLLHKISTAGPLIKSPGGMPI